MNKSEKVKNEILSKYKSIREFSKSVGIPNSTLVSALDKKNGIEGMAVEKVIKICDKLNLDVKTFDPLQINYDPILKYSRTPVEKYIVNNLGKLSDDGQNLLKKHLNSILEYESELKKIQTKKAELIELKPQVKELTVYDLPASAGSGQFLDSDNFQVIEFPVNEIPKNTTFGVRVSGNSMEPQFFDKDIAFVQRVPEVASGNIGVFILNGDAYIKKMVCDQDECYLVSLNTVYDPIKIKDEDDLRVVGKVLWIN